MTTAYLVLCREDGYGDVHPLLPDQHYTLGRAATNSIVLKDDLCSREHAEVTFSNGQWSVQDLNSLNGTRLNGDRLEKQENLAPGDEIRVGRTAYLFVEDMGELPGVPLEPPVDSRDDLSIKKRLGQTRYLTPMPSGQAEAREDATEQADPTEAGEDRESEKRHSLSRDLALLYRLALDMGSATEEEELVRIVLDALIEATSAEVGAILSLQKKEAAPRGKKNEADGTFHGPPLNAEMLSNVNRASELALVKYRHRDPSRDGYIRPSEYVSKEVLASKEAILAENVARDRFLRNRESLTDLGVTSLICAPIIFGDRLFGLIHLYCTDLHRALSTEDLEFSVAVAKQLGTVLNQFLMQVSLKEQNRSLRQQLQIASELIGESPPIKAIEQQIGLVAQTNATCLIRGESGSGKELVARAIHYSSNRRDGPFVCLNCAALTETLLESELFGHERGSFTGATEQKIGKFEAANQGTIFLDEIGEMNVGTQAKLLRILEGHPFERVGGSVPIHVDVRVVAATNLPLEEAVHEGTFRRDLFFRLQVVEITVPPLRERKEDIPLLADHFLKRFVNETARKIQDFTAAAMKKMQEYHWPGNVRELRNVVERAVALGQGKLIDANDIWLSSLEGPAISPFDPNAPYEPLSLEDVEKLHIERTLKHTEWKKRQAAQILSIARPKLDGKIKAYKLTK